MARLKFKLEDGTEIETELDSDVITIGRHPGSNVVLPSASVSAHHATIKRRGDSFYVQDLGTTNGTKLNGVDVEEAKLEEGDRLSFGDVPASVELGEVAAKKKETAPPLPPPDVARSGPVKGRAPAKGKGAARAPRRGYSKSTYTQSSGCAGFIAVLMFLTLAFAAGLIIRHWVIYHRFLVIDLSKRVQERYLGSDSEAPAGKPDKDKAKAKDDGATDSK